MTSQSPIVDGFADTCARHRDKVAIVDGDRRLTFGELDRLSAAAAASLGQLGVGPGDVVSYQLPNWWEAVVIFLAGARIGACVNPLLPLFREHELAQIVAQAQPKVIVVPGHFRGVDYRALVRSLRAQIPHVFIARDEAAGGMRPFTDLIHPRGKAPEHRPTPESILLLMYTSGTTAAPKGVLHTHATLGAEVHSLERVHALTPADTTLMPSPLTHISGVIHAILTPALLGTAAVLMERWDPLAALQLIAAERVTYMVGAPTFLRDLTDGIERQPVDASSLRLFSCGGADVSPDLIRQARARLGCVAKRVYGSTEFPTLTTTDAADAESMGIETEGRVIAPAEIRAVDESGVIVRPSEDGEIQARGPECFVGYSDPALNADAFTADGWFRTGDLGQIDADGYLRITGRLKEIVIRKGEKFSVRELEDHIAAHPAVDTAAVIALPDAHTGERACAVVVLRADATLSLPELAAFLSGRGLAKQKLPEQLEIVAVLPRTDSGKIQRQELKRTLLQRD